MESTRIVSDAVHLPFVDERGPAFRWRLGLRPLDPDDWFEWGETAERAVAAKTSVMERNPATAFAVADDVLDESDEVLALVVDHLAERSPNRSVAPDPRLHPLDAAARLVPDDLVLMVERDDRLVVGGGSVCFPNRWDLRSKLGRTMSEVHAPVPGLNDQIGAPIERTLRNLEPGRRWWRLGWGVIATDDWYAPLDGTADRSRAATANLRVERETLRRLPTTGAVLFTIRTHVTPLHALAPDTRRTLAERISAMSDDVRNYKGVDEVVGALDDVLAAPVGRPTELDII